MQTTKRILRIRSVEDKTGLPQSSIYEKMKQGKFPKSIALGPKTKGWIEDEVDAWIDARIAERGEAA